MVRAGEVNGVGWGGGGGGEGGIEGKKQHQRDGIIACTHLHCESPSSLEH